MEPQPNLKVGEMKNIYAQKQGRIDDQCGCIEIHNVLTE
jgi:hypothetical protein